MLVVVTVVRVSRPRRSLRRECRRREKLAQVAPAPENSEQQRGDWRQEKQQQQQKLVRLRGIIRVLAWSRRRGRRLTRESQHHGQRRLTKLQLVLGLNAAVVPCPRLRRPVPMVG